MHAVPLLTRSPAQPQSLTHRLTNGFICQSPSFFLYLSTYLLYVPAYLLIFPLTNFSLIIHPFPPSIPFFLHPFASLFVRWFVDGFGTLGCRSTMEKVQLNWLPICVWELHTFLCFFFWRMKQCHKGSIRETLGGHVRMIWWSLKRKSPKAFVERAVLS